MCSAEQCGHVVVKVAGMGDLDLQRRQMARFESGIVLSMSQPTIASRIEALLLLFRETEAIDRDALFTVIAVRLASTR